MLGTPLHSATLLLLTALLFGCQATPAPEPGDAGGDVTDQRVLLVGFSPNEQVRHLFENRLQQALETKAVDAIPSHPLITDFIALEHGAILAAARDSDANLILMVRRLAAADHHGEGDSAAATAEAERRLRAYRTLQDFLASADQRSPAPPPPSRQVVEVYGYLRDGAGASLIWSGFSWVEYDGDLERAITATADIIADNMARSRDAVRSSLGGTP